MGQIAHKGLDEADQVVRADVVVHPFVEEGAEIDDGCLNLYSLEFDRLWKLALVYPAFRKGRHGMWKEVRTMCCREVEIRTARPKAVNTDGEITTQTPAKFRVLQRAVSVFVPAEGTDRGQPDK